MSITNIIKPLKLKYKLYTQNPEIIKGNGNSFFVAKVVYGKKTINKVMKYTSYVSEYNAKKLPEFFKSYKYNKSIAKIYDFGVSFNKKQAFFKFIMLWRSYLKFHTQKKLLIPQVSFIEQEILMMQKNI